MNRGALRGYKQTPGGFAEAGLYQIKELTVLTPTPVLTLNVPRGFKHLELRMGLRSDLASTADTVRIAYNDDVAAANYDSERIATVSNSALATEVLGSGGGADARIVGLATAGTATAGLYGQIIARIFDYANPTQYKICKWENCLWFNRSAGGIILEDGFHGWASFASIDKISLYLQTGPNFVPGSNVSLYGIRAGS